MEKIPIERTVKCETCQKSFELVGEFEFSDDGPQLQTREFKCPYCPAINTARWPTNSAVMHIRYIPEQM